MSLENLDIFDVSQYSGEQNLDVRMSMNLETLCSRQKPPILMLMIIKLQVEFDSPMIPVSVAVITSPYMRHGY